MAGAPSGHVGKSDIAPVSTADRVTPGAKSAKKAPWRSPGVALAKRDENNPERGSVPPKSAPGSARGSLGTRKLDVRSPLTAGASKTRGGKPRLEPETPSEETSEIECDDAVTSAVDAVNTILLTPPSARGKPSADVTGAFDTVAMPPPPPRVPVTTNDQFGDENSGALASEIEMENEHGALDDFDLNSATTAIPRHVLGAAHDIDAVSEEQDTLLEEEEQMESNAKEDPKTPAAPSLGSPFSVQGTSLKPSPNTGGDDALDSLNRTMDDLTPLKVVDDVTETHAGGFGVTKVLPRLATPTMDLTPLQNFTQRGNGVSPAPMPMAAPSPKVIVPTNHGVKQHVVPKQPPTRRGFDATLFDPKDFEPTETVPGLFEAQDFEMTEQVNVNIPTKLAKTPGVSPSVKKSFNNSSKTPGSAKIPPRIPTTPKTGGATPQWARDLKGAHKAQQAQMELLMAQAKRDIDEARNSAHSSGNTISETEQRQMELTAMLEEQKALLDEQRMELRQEKEESEKMKLELKQQMEAQERTRRRVSEISKRAASAPGGSSLSGFTQSMDLGEFAMDAALASGNTPANLQPVEQQLRQCREAISARAIESERLTARQRQLQREEADLHFRVAELQRYALRLALDPSAKLPADLPPIPAPMQYISAQNMSGPLPGGDAQAALDYYSAVAATAQRGPQMRGSMDEDGFYVVDLTKSTSTGGSGGSGVTTSVPVIGQVQRTHSNPPVTSAFGGYGGVPGVQAVGASDDAAVAGVVAAQPAVAAPVDAIAAIASRRAPSQVLELRKEVVDVCFVGYGGETGGDDVTPPSALLTATADGCLRLFGAGNRRPAAIIRGPKEGIAAVAAVGVEAFVAAAGSGGYVARYDLAAGRELGALLAVPVDDASGSEFSSVSTSNATPRQLACVAAGGPGSGLVAAAGEGGDVHLWDSRVAPRGSRRASSAVGGTISAGVAPVMTLRVPGASSVNSVSLALDGVTLATTASNGARVFDLRAPASDRPARLAATEPGQRWSYASHVGCDIFTVSTSGDVFAWSRKDEGYSAPWKPARAHRDAAYVASNDAAHVLDSVGHGAGRVATSAPTFAAAPHALGIDSKRLVLSASGDKGECVRAWDSLSGDTIGEWGADGRSVVDAGAAVRGYGMGVAHAPVTAACWGSGAEHEQFGKTSFAVGNAEGVVRVYGP